MRRGRQGPKQSSHKLAQRERKELPRTTPMLPVSVLGWATILVAGAEM